MIDWTKWKLVPVEATQAMLDAAEKIDWSGEDVQGNCCNQWYAMLAAAPQHPAVAVEVTDEMAESAMAIIHATREELARAGGGVHGGPLGCRRRRKRVERDCSPRLAQEPRPQGDRGWGVSRTWVAVGVRGNWSVEDLAKPNGENIVADCGNDPWSESNARKIAKAQDEITALRARIAELERDAARLSWIEEKTNSAERPIEEGRPVDAVATIREAIDKAMDAGK